MREGLPWRRERPPAVAHTGPVPDIEYVMAPETEEPRLRDYWRKVIPRWRLVLVMFLAVFVLGGAITFRTTPLYTASSTVRIESQNVPVIGGMEVSPGGDHYFQTQVSLLKGRALAAQVIKNLGLEQHPNFVVSSSPFEKWRGWLSGTVQANLARVFQFLGIAPPPLPPSPQQGSASAQERELGIPSNAINRYLRLLSVEPILNTQLVRISFSTIDPHLSRELANAHAEAFIRRNLETRFELTKEAREFLEKKLDELKVKVAHSEQALSRFRKAHGVVSLDGSENIVVDRMVDLNRRLTEARARRIELESLSKIIKDKNFAHLTQVIDNNLIVQFRSRLEELEAERARLATIYKSNHPRFVELNEQLNQARQRLNGEIRTVVRAIESDFAAAQAREKALQDEADRQQQSALTLKELAVQHTLLQGDLDANRSIYTNIATRLNETSVSTDSPISNIQIVEAAERPLGPSSPQIERNLILASGLGLFLGVGLALFLEYSNSALRTPDEVWQAVAVPTLGIVPDWRSMRRREYGYERLPRRSPLRYLTSANGGENYGLSQTLVASYHPFSLVSESYRSIRSALLLTQRDKPLQVLLLTSARPSEGKTSVTLNLAITLAQAGRQVVVVDADLRAGNCHTLLALDNRHGLVDVLRDGLPLERALQPTAVGGLFLLARGRIPSNPTDLLASDRMAELLQTLRERFDLVLIDSPPAIAVSDAVVLSIHSDGILLVLRAHQTPPAAVQRVIERLETVGASIIGSVLVGVDFRNPEFIDYHKYYSSYYSAIHKGRKPQS